MGVGGWGGIEAEESILEPALWFGAETQWWQQGDWAGFAAALRVELKALDRVWGPNARKSRPEPDVVVHACNPSTLGD